MVLDAGYPNTTGFRKVVKATILVKKKPGMSDEDFIQHYNHKPAQMAAPVLERHHIITYSLTYCLQRDRTILRDMLRGKGAEICTFVFGDEKDLARSMYDPGRMSVDRYYSHMRCMRGDGRWMEDDHPTYYRNKCIVSWSQSNDPALAPTKGHMALSQSDPSSCRHHDSCGDNESHTSIIHTYRYNPINKQTPHPRHPSPIRPPQTRETKKMPDQDPPQPYEIRPDPQPLTAHPDPTHNAPTGVDYEPHPASSLPLSPARQHILDSITRLYSGSASEADMRVYAARAVYDDPWSYCDTRFKIAGQWYGIPKVMAESRTVKTEVVENEDDRIVFKLQQEYTPRVAHFSKVVNSLVSLSLDGEGKVKYHKDMWNHNDYSHEGLGKIMKTLNGDHLTKITQPPKSL
ncbi:hypothetical protein Tdes44962_MAKER06191 [Teratosphaeria destructans]|uniref:Uncharacterized protein n=1 Tax=Teratosphaeria destructans TaxID=418781 RepID=A0A9W7SI06_9PEZI|nr:hypothetical protein Tdes44962_MAKER06191 [Teratosphaeria destructans]